MNKLIIVLIVAVPMSVVAQNSSVTGDFVGFMSFNSERVISLAEEIDEDKYDWSPAEGVRSIQDCILHIASANYFFGTMYGSTLPEGVNPMTLEKDIKGKENVIQTLKDSYSFISEAGGGLTEEQLKEEVDFPTGDKFSKSMTLNIAISHVSEHMGQLVAYARSNGITPPWSQ